MEIKVLGLHIQESKSLTVDLREPMFMIYLVQLIKHKEKTRETKDIEESVSGSFSLQQPQKHYTTKLTPQSL